MSRRLSQMLGTVMTVFVILLVYAFNSVAPESSNDLGPELKIPKPIETPFTTSSTVETNAFVVRVVDGDTISAKIDGTEGETKIRFLGINTPESVDPRRPVECFGKEASARLRMMIEGQRVRLEEDPKADERDKYGRLLRNVFAGDGTDVNLQLVQDGYAQALLDYPLTATRKQELKAAEQSAKLAERGLWSPEACTNSP
jgi:micrococcal nuclease